MRAKKENNEGGFLLKMHPLQRIAISIVVTTIVFFIIPKIGLTLIYVMLAWEVFALCFLILSWLVIIKRPLAEIRRLAKKDDGSIIFVVILIMVSSLASMFTVLLLIISQSKSSSTNVLYLPVAISGMILSWLMVHTIYIFHYAHMYYANDKKNAGKDAFGLNFPGDEKPNYLDFAYFSFVIACTFQVSDVEISSPKIRRVALFHGLLSFGLNTFVVALTINIIAGLSN